MMVESLYIVFAVYIDLSHLIHKMVAERSSRGRNTMDTFENEELEPRDQQTDVQPEPDMEPVAEAEPVIEEEPAVVEAQPEPIPEEQPVEEQTPEEQPVAAPTAYRGSGSGRKESPYANSPYEMNHQPKPEYTPGYTFQPQTQPKPKVKKEKKVRKVSSFGRKAVALLLVIALVAAGCGITAGIVNSRWEEQAAQQSAAMAQMQKQLDALQKQADNSAKNGNLGIAVSGEALTPAQVYARNVDSVVAITTSIVSTTPYGTTEGSSAGSGFILSADGYIVTNYHVIADASTVSVVTYDGAQYTATVVGSDSTNDLAVLKVEAENLPAATLGSSDELIIGDMVVAIGNPLGDLTSTQTVGYVSGKNREIATDNTIIEMIQTDAAINPGNSGGPLFNMKGEVVGITTAKYSGTTSSGASIEGIGFAIPIDDVLTIISDLVDYGYVTGAYLGVTVQNMDETSAAMYGLPMGAYVLEVVEGASADRAGIQPKDIIIALGEYQVESITDLTRNLRNFRAGDTTTVTIVRSGAQMDLSITFDERPVGFTGTVPSQEDTTEMPDEGSYEEWFDYFRRYFGGE